MMASLVARRVASFTVGGAPRPAKETGVDNLPWTASSCVLAMSPYLKAAWSVRSNFVCSAGERVCVTWYCGVSSEASPRKAYSSLPRGVIWFIWFMCACAMADSLVAADCAAAVAYGSGARGAGGGSSSSQHIYLSP